MKVTRRMVLAATGALAVGATVGSVGVHWWNQPAGSDLRALSDSEFHFAQALAEAWMPPGGDPALSGADAGLGHFLDEVVARMAPPKADQFKFLLQACDASTLPTDFSRFSALPLARRSELLNDWMRSGSYLRRQALSGVLSLMSFGWTIHPDVVQAFRPYYGCWYGP